MEKIIITARGSNGIIELMENIIRIKKTGIVTFLLQGFKGDKEIQISQIGSIQFKRSGMVTKGYIQFTFLGGQESKEGLLDATQDENTVMFDGKAQEKQFEAVKEAIEKRIAEIQGRGGKSSSNLDELEKLAQLREKGIITEQEFQAKKKQLLGL